MAQPTETELTSELGGMLSNLLSPSNLTEVSELLRPEGEDDCVQQVTGAELAATAAADYIQDNDDVESEKENYVFPGTTEQLHAIALKKKIAEHAG